MGLKDEILDKLAKLDCKDQIKQTQANVQVPESSMRTRVRIFLCGRVSE